MPAELYIGDDKQMHEGGEFGDGYDSNDSLANKLWFKSHGTVQQQVHYDEWVLSMLKYIAVEPHAKMGAMAVIKASGMEDGNRQGQLQQEVQSLLNNDPEIQSMLKLLQLDKDSNEVRVMVQGIIKRRSAAEQSVQECTKSKEKKYRKSKVMTSVRCIG